MGAGSFNWTTAILSPLLNLLETRDTPPHISFY
jgi:hypothetical protein